MKTSPFRRIADGTVWSFLAEALILPTGLITAAYLTRALGPEGYGLFTLTTTLIIWMGFVVTSLFSRATIKLVAEAEDWRAAGTTILRAHFICGLATTLIVLVLGRPIAILLDEPRVTFYFVVFALEPLIFALSRAHRNVLIGIGQFRKQAVPTAWGSAVRLVLIVAFVEMGFSIEGALLGILGATLVELVIYRWYIRPPFFPASNFPASALWIQGRLVFVSALCLQLFSRVDLFALSALGRPIAEVGYYSAAQNLSIVPALFAMAFTPLLLSTVSRMLKDGQFEAARTMGVDAIRLVLGMLPFAGMAAGAAREVAVVIFGADFESTGPILALLIFGKVAVVMISVAIVVMIAADKPGLSIALAAPMLALALAGHIALIPEFGTIGAASVTSVLEVAGAIAAVAVVYRLWHISPRAATIARTLVLSATAYLMAWLWPTPGLWVIGKLVLIMLMIPAGFALLGEFKANEIAWARSILRLPARQG